MELNIIYEPIQAELASVEDKVKSLSKAELTWLPPDLAGGLKDGGRVDELLGHILTAGGKRLRPALVLLSAKFYDYEMSRILPMATAIEVLHIATLVHDDAIDNSALRRGRPTINSIWGDNAAILLGDYLVAKAGELAAATGNVEMPRRLFQTLMTITSGELAQAFNAFDLEQSRRYYLHRIASKTAALLSLAAEVGATLSRAPLAAISALKEYGLNIGMAFQIVDDILDYIGTTEEMGKPVGSDLAEGTITLPVLLLMEHYPENNPVRDMLQDKDRESNRGQVIELIRNSPQIIQECYRTATSYCQKATQALAILSDIPSRKSLAALADFIVQRRR